MSDEPNRRIGDYEILGVLGAGGMGQVFKVRNTISDRIEAMKIILPDLAGRQDLADRFLREIKLLASLDHPNIAALRTALTVDNQLVMIMEYVEGTTLAAKLEQRRFSVAESVNYTDQVLAALSYAHQRNVIHRDIKPSNMMLTLEGTLKLMDFGIARSGDTSDLTATGEALGSLYYMPPEQVKGQPTDARSDLYSVGASLYEMVTGQRPFKADSSYSLMAAQVQQPPKPPIEVRTDLPLALNEIILLAMAKDPAQRFQSANAFRNALKAVDGAEIRSESLKAAASSISTSSFAVMQAPSTDATPQASEIPSIVPSSPSNVPVPSVLEMSHQQSGSKGKYMALGGLLVVAFLVVAGLYMPRLSKTRAVGHDQGAEHVSAPMPPVAPTENATVPVPTDNNQAASPAASVPETPQAAPATNDSAMPASSPSGAPAPSLAKHAGTAVGQQVKTAATKSALVADRSSAETATPPPPDNSAALSELEQQVDQLTARAAAVNDSLENLRRQQAAQGFGLRGDMAAAQERMKYNINRAQSALQARDVEGTRKYTGMSEAELTKLEGFLGR